MGRRMTLPDPTPPAQVERALVGGRYVRLLQDQLEGLHALPVHGNRSVHLDHLVVAHLLAFFNPSLRGLRSIEDIFDLRVVRERFGTPRLAKSTVSDAQRVFDPALLLPLIASLQERAGIQPHDSRLDVLTRELLAVDGTFFTVAPRIAWAVFNGSGKGNVRGHFQFNILRGLPEHVTLTDGHASETEQLRQSLKPGCFYVADRGFHRYDLLTDILAAGSDFLIRLRSSATWKVLEDLPLDHADIAAGIAADRRITLGWRADQTPELPNLRCVEVSTRDREGKPQTLLLLTNRLDLPAWMIALLYQHRWQVELFFRWLKCMAHFNHFFSESKDGMTLQVYITLIALLLIALETGARPSKYDYALLGVAWAGLAPLDDVLAVAARRRSERQRAAEKDRQRRAKKTAP
jgi:Transposase DDE domain